MPERSVPVADPQANYRELSAEIDAAIRGVLEGPTYILGTPVAKFEEEFAKYVGTQHGVGVNNGTDAIHLALRALGVGPGDEVITVSHTAVATVAAIRMSGAEPVLADVDAGTYTLAPEAVHALISERTKAVIAVHLYGHPADLAALSVICREYGLFLIEDCAQAHGALFHGGMVGSFGDAATFSFYPTKNLGAIGDGGMVLTADATLATRLRLLRQYGWDVPQNSLLEGWNTRLDPVQAAILSVKLRHLPTNAARRRALAASYDTGLSGLPLHLPVEKVGVSHAYHLYVIRVSDRAVRDALRQFLGDAGVQTAVHYPYPVHLQPAYAKKFRTGSLVVTEQLAGTVLSLPLYPELPPTDQARVIEAVRSFFQ